MPDEKYVSKVVANGQTLIDLTSDTVDAAHLLSTYTAHGANGAPITGSCTYDVDSSSVTAATGEVLAGKTFAKNGSILTGTMTDREGVTGYISDKSTPYEIQEGHHDGSGKVYIDTTEAAKIIAGNIKDGVSILGVTGTYTGEGVTAQAKNATPTWSSQTILPDSGYDYLSQVTIAAIPRTDTDNAAGGITVTIG